jgi:pimeloyl-ACP methyl ester carboxylesterase
MPSLNVTGVDDGRRCPRSNQLKRNMLGSESSQPDAAVVRHVTMTCAVRRCCSPVAGRLAARRRLFRTVLLTLVLFTLFLPASAWGAAHAGVSAVVSVVHADLHPAITGSNWGAAQAGVSAVPSVLHAGVHPASTGSTWIQNPGFESPLAGTQQSGPPANQSFGNWLSIEPGPGVYTEAPSPVHSGSSSASIDDPGNSPTYSEGAMLQDIASFPSDQSYTLSGWVYPSQGFGSVQLVFGWDRTTTTSPTTASPETTAVEFTPFGSGSAAFQQFDTAPAVTYNTWHYFQLVVDAASLTSQFYIDGSLIGTTAPGTAVAAGLPTTMLLGTPNDPNATSTNQFYWDDLSLTTAGAATGPLSDPILVGKTPFDSAPTSSCSSVPAIVVQPVGCRGRKIEDYGDPTIASHIAVIVEGVGTSYSNFDGYFKNETVNIGRAIHRLYPGSNTAVILWFGYDAPPSLPGGLPEASYSKDADLGAAQLETYISSLRTQNRDPTHLSITVIGHSYGSVVAAHAASALGPQDNLVFVGSPGVDFPNADSLPSTGYSPPAYRVFAAANPNDVVVDLATSRAVADIHAASNVLTFIRSGPDLSDFANIGHGPNPASSDSAFGAQIFGTDGECGHEYFSDQVPPGYSGPWSGRPAFPQGLKNLAAIITDNFGDVTPERRPSGTILSGSDPLVPFLPAVNLQLDDDCRTFNVTFIDPKVMALGQKVLGTVKGLAKDVKQGGVAVTQWVGNKVQSVADTLSGASSSLFGAHDLRLATVAGRNVAVARGSHGPARAGKVRVVLHFTLRGRALLNKYLRQARSDHRHHRKSPRLHLSLRITARSPRNGRTSTTTESIIARP